MATSGSIDFTARRDDIITEALELVGAIGEGQTPTSDQIVSCSRTLNNLVKAWHNEGIGLDIAVRTYLFLEKDQVEYVLHPNGSDHYVTDYTYTTTIQGEDSGNSSIQVESATGIADGYVIGVELTDGTRQWTTVNGAPVGTAVTLTDALTDDVCLGASVFVYSTRSTFSPVDILNVTNKNTSDVETIVNILVRQEYIELANKTSSGNVNQVWYDRHDPEGNLFVYPSPSDSEHVLVIWIHKTPEDVDVAHDDVEFPQEAYLALSFNLASLLSHKYGLDPGSMDRLAARAKNLKDEISGFDREGSISFTPRFF